MNSIKHYYFSRNNNQFITIEAISKSMKHFHAGINLLSNKSELLFHEFVPVDTSPDYQTPQFHNLVGTCTNL